NWVPLALANELIGIDLEPTESEITATFNGALNSCTNGRQDWYYGFDGKAGDKSDLLYVVMHELGHGLGFLSLVDLKTGETELGRFDAYSTHVFDLALGQPWTALTDAQRLQSIRSPRGVVWDGPNVARQAAQLLIPGAPILRTTPVLAGLTTRVSEAEFGPYAADRPASGPLKVGTLSPVDCQLQGSAAGAVVLLTQSICAPIQQAWSAQQAGAVAVLLADDQGRDPPNTADTDPSDRPMFPVTIPVLAVSVEDAMVLAAAPPGTAVQISAE